LASRYFSALFKRKQQNFLYKR